MIAFITNSGWIDGNSHDGFRASLQKEFDKIYVYNLRGSINGRNGEAARREGKNVFDIKTGVAITILVRYPKKERLDKCEIYYHDIGDYLSREVKLNRIKEAHSYTSLDWQTIQPNEKHDWINQRDGVFDTLLPLAPEKKFDTMAQSVFTTYSLGIATSRDAFLYNYSSGILKHTASETIDYYNQQRELLNSNPNHEVIRDPKKIVWNEMLEIYAKRNEPIVFDQTKIVEGIYRPFCKQKLLFQKNLIQRTYQQLTFFPTPQHQNLVICLSGQRGLCSFITDIVPDLHFVGDTQCFPLYWYEENKAVQTQNLFGEESSERWIQRDGITDWFLTEVRSRFSGAKNLTKEDIFYYVYGLLHSPDYRERFADDLRKSLPNIPIVERVDDFMAFSKAGRALANLHLSYEDHAHKAGVRVEERESGSMDEYAYYAVEKMRFPRKGERSTIIYNGRITIEKIPEAAYEYIVNGKSAIEWIMERYAVTTDKKSGIKNDPNLWSSEHNQPRYILDLLLSIIHVSIETQRIVNTLPKLTFERKDENQAND